MARKHYTDVIGTLGSGGLTNVAITHTFTSLTYVNGTAVPTLAAGESFLLSILDATGAVLEVVNVTAYNSGTKAATIARAQEGTTAIAHAGSLNVANSVYPSDMAPAWGTIDGGGTGTLLSMSTTPTIVPFPSGSFRGAGTSFGTGGKIVADTAGVYHVVFSLTLVGNGSTPYVVCWLRQTAAIGGTTTDYKVVGGALQNLEYNVATLTQMLTLAAGDTIHVVGEASGSTCDVEKRSHFTAHRIGPA